MGFIQDSAENRMNTLHREIVALDREINGLQNEYNSLIRFKGAVCEAQRNSVIANNHRRGILKGVNGIKKNNKVAEKYQSGMDDQLVWIGKNVVDESFNGLQRRIDRKLE